MTLAELEVLPEGTLVYGGYRDSTEVDLFVKRGREWHGLHPLRSGYILWSRELASDRLWFSRLLTPLEILALG